MQYTHAHVQTWKRELPFFLKNMDILYKSLILKKLAALHKSQAESCQVMRTLILIQENSYAHAQLQAYWRLTDLWVWNLPSFQQRELQRTHFSTKEAKEGSTLVKYSDWKTAESP